MTESYELLARPRYIVVMLLLFFLFAYMQSIYIRMSAGDNRYHFCADLGSVHTTGRVLDRRRFRSSIIFAIEHSTACCATFPIKTIKNTAEPNGPHLSCPSV